LVTITKKLTCFSHCITPILSIKMNSQISKSMSTNHYTCHQWILFPLFSLSTVSHLMKYHTSSTAITQIWDVTVCIPHYNFEWFLFFSSIHINTNISWYASHKTETVPNHSQCNWWFVFHFSMPVYIRCKIFRGNE
jgi:hypothetical protein